MACKAVAALLTFATILIGFLSPVTPAKTAHGFRATLARVHPASRQLLRRGTSRRPPPPAPFVPGRGRRGDDHEHEHHLRPFPPWSPRGAGGERRGVVPHDPVRRHAAPGLPSHHRHRERPHLDAVRAVHRVLRAAHATVRPSALLHVLEAPVREHPVPGPAERLSASATPPAASTTTATPLASPRATSPRTC